jgi:UDP-N-acetylmuramoyl-tripeptide--D-alanyl-D-alanine ligase
MIEPIEYTLQTISNLFSSRPHFTYSEFLTSITTSSQEVNRGSLFIPLLGKRDGHTFIKESLDRGASAFLYERKNPHIDTLTKAEISKGIEVKSTLFALGRIAKFHRDRFLPFVVCITGSSGKTTSKEILGKCVSYLGEEHLVVTEKNYNNEIGLPFTLLKIRERTKVCILELGMNHRYEISRMTHLASPHTVMITNIGPCHIENLGSLKEIAKAKAEIIEGGIHTKIYIPEDILYEEIFLEKAKKVKSKVFSFSLKSSEHLKILSKESSGFTLELFGEQLEWKLPVPKVLENLAGCMDLLVEEGFDPLGILKGIRNFSPANNRNVLIEKEIKIIDDCYNANPDSMKSSLDSLLQVAGNQKSFAILGDMKELGDFSKRYHKEIGHYCSLKNINGVICFGNDAYYIYNEFKKSDRICFHFDDMEDSIPKIAQELKTIVSVGDVVLVKGSRSMKMERIVEELNKLF